MRIVVASIGLLLSSLMALNGAAANNQCALGGALRGGEVIEKFTPADYVSLGGKAVASINATITKPAIWTVQFSDGARVISVISDQEVIYKAQGGEARIVELRGFKFDAAGKISFIIHGLTKDTKNVDPSTLYICK